MLTLGIIDLVGDDDLTDGAVIAGTGTIDADGTVGPIGGIPLKMIAAARHRRRAVPGPGRQLRGGPGRRPARPADGPGGHPGRRAGRAGRPPRRRHPARC